MALPKRKPNRLQNFDYSTPGAYFITICTEEKRCTLGNIVGGGDLDAPTVHLSRIGKLVQQNIELSGKIPCVHVDKYVIMPNHIHLILLVDATNTNGTSRSPSPTNAVIPHFVTTFKRFCNKASKRNLFQRSYHDHIIRGEKDYRKIWEYIDTNPARWADDCFYVEM